MISNEAFDELNRIRDRYQNRRTIGYQLMAEVSELVERAIVAAQREAEARADGRIVEADRQLEQLRKDRDQWREHYHRVERALDEKRRLLEERAQQGEEVQVTIGRSLGGWIVSDLEEIAYRLRCGGAVDETPVKVTEYTATAKVVAPNLVPLTRPSETPAAPEPPPEPVVVETRRAPWSHTEWLGLAAGAMLGVLMLLGLQVMFG